MTVPSTTLLVLAKEPVPGRVKTRLCPPCTPAQAAAIARAAISDTLAAVTAIGDVRPRLVLDGRPGPWSETAIPTVAQTDGTLGERLTAAFTPITGPAMLIGMDTPQVTSAELAHVVAMLHRPAVDAVLGLTPDGGWWVIGFARPVPGAFDDVPMSTAVTGRRQLARLHALGLRTAIVRPATDVDTFADALDVAARHPQLAFARTVRSVVATHARIWVAA